MDRWLHRHALEMRRVMLFALGVAEVVRSGKQGPGHLTLVLLTVGVLWLYRGATWVQRTNEGMAA